MQIQPNVSTTHTPTVDPGVPTAGDPSATNSIRVAQNHPSGMQNVDIPNIITAPNWTAILSAVQGSGPPLDLLALQTALTASTLLDDFAELGHIFKAESMKPEYELNLRTLPKQILQMVYLKLFIPLSLLTTSALDKIQFNDGLKYQKIIFGSNAGKHMLDISIFPVEKYEGHSLGAQKEMGMRR